MDVQEIRAKSSFLFYTFHYNRKEGEKPHMKKWIICLVLLVMMSGCQNNNTNEVEEYTQIGIGQASYVIASNATDAAYGQMEVHTVIATVVVDQDGIIEETYFDESENSILFTSRGKIVTNGRVQEWPTKKEADNEYLTLMSDFEQSLVGLTLDECFAKMAKLPLNEADIQMHQSALQSAFDKKERVDNMDCFTLGIVNRHLFDEAYAESNGEAGINTTYALLCLDDQGKTVSVKLDEIYNVAAFDETGTVLTSRFDTRSKVEKKEDYGLLPFSKLHVEYYLQIASLEEALIGKTTEEIEEYFKSDTLLTHCSINTSDLLHALRKAYTSLAEA